MHMQFINPQVLDRIEGEATTLYSEDTVCDDDPDNPLLDPNGAAAAHRMNVTPEMLHIETPSGMPYHELTLKPGAIAILIRNLDVSAGLVNGLRVEIVEVSRTRVRVRALSGGANICGKTFDLSRIAFEGDLDATVRMRRVQFPLRLAFAMTVNKSQGLTLRKVST
jgi:hypothetical protein